MNDPVITTIASYEVKANEYIQNTDQLSYFPDLPAMLDKFISLLPGKKVLDMAFGSGRDTIYLSQHDLSVQGIELTQAFIDSVRKKVNNPISKMDMRWLGFADNAFDGIWCCAAFLHIPRAQTFETLKGFSRVLKPKGILYFDLKEGYGEEWKDEGNINNERRFFTYYTLDEITKILVDLNFEILFARRQEHAKKSTELNKPLWLNIICRKSLSAFDTAPAFQQVAEKKQGGQLASGNYIAQADQGSNATINITQEVPLKLVAAVAPLPPSNFTGRGDTLLALKDLLIKNKTPTTVALVGMAGIGKTATTKKLSANLKEYFPGGIFWASLPDVNGNSLPILRTWAFSCAYELASDLDPQTMSTLVRGLLAQREHELGPMLFVIDDVRKEWLNAAKLLKETLSPAGTMLITTRDEYLAQVLNSTIYHLDILLPHEATELLATLIDKDVIDKNRQESQRTVELLGYLPLAIELTGKKLSRLLRKPGYDLSNLRMEVEARASDTLALPGHPGLASTFGVTYDSLDSSAREVFRWLGSFSSGPIFGIDVFGTLKIGMVFSGNEAALEFILDDLVQLSLVNWGAVPHSYTLHPLLQQYAQTLLNNEGTEILAHKAHISYFANFFPAQIEDIKTTFGPTELRLANFLLAAERAYEVGDNTSFIRFVKLFGKTNGYLYLRGYWNEALSLLMRGYEISEETDDSNTARDMLWHLGTIKREKGQYAEARKLFELSVEKDTQASDRYKLANSLFGLGYVHVFLAEYGDAETKLREAVNVSKEVGNKYALGESLRGLGRVYLSQNNLKEARGFFKKSIPLLKQSNNDQGRVYALRGLGETLQLLNNFQEALIVLSDALQLAEHIQDKQAVGYTLRALGNLYVATEEYSLAKDVYIKCMDICRVIGELGSLAATQCLLADVLIKLGKLDDAEELYQQSKSSSISLGLNRWKAQSEFGLAKVYYEYGRKEEAFRLANSSLILLRSIKHREAEIAQKWIDERFS